ncbi:MAG: hypothetical protein GY851_13520, partial [bacterium]|nr:hypothetical protein [bacterium]
VATDLSVAYVDAHEAGTLKVFIDSVERLAQPANVPFVDVDGSQHYMENRKGILGLGYGVHTVRIEAADAPVAVLGLFTYDSRPNRAFERRLLGHATPGETVSFSQPFKARPMVLCQGGLAVQSADVTTSSVCFGGDSPGTYEIIGE